jgi:hypothetical protein
VVALPLGGRRDGAATVLEIWPPVEGEHFGVNADAGYRPVRCGAVLCLLTWAVMLVRLGGSPDGFALDAVRTTYDDLPTSGEVPYLVGNVYRFADGQTLNRNSTTSPSCMT